MTDSEVDAWNIPFELCSEISLFFFLPCSRLASGLRLLFSLVMLGTEEGGASSSFFDVMKLEALRVPWNVCGYSIVTHVVTHAGHEVRDALDGADDFTGV